MSTYSAPLRDMHFVLRELAGIAQVGQLPGYEEATPDTVDAILDEAAKFASGVLAPLNASGDQEGAVWRDSNVTMPAGFKEAYRQFIENGWNGIGAEPEYGGQGMPYTVVAAVNEMWKASNMAFSLCPLLTTGAIEAITLNGSPELKAAYLPKMIEGSWTGTMNLTEPQAGSDLALVRARAVPQGDGSYKIFGQKIFITYGEHDMTNNIIHLVLARTPDAPEGVKGISLFVVPKFILNADGTPGARNDVRCVSIEHKLGIHASPTCVMAYGDSGGATGYLVGKENEGLKYMFVMMNAARFAVGLEGVAIAERAYQQALQYARDRIQGRDLADGSGPVPIVRHPDIRRMLMLMKAQTEAMRALAYVVAAAHDAARRHPDAEERKRNLAFVEFMIPIVKGWSTETGIDVASLGIQIHGGMGFIEETGAAQHWRDARITTIYEGTTGIQAMDLIGRKIVRDGGATLKSVLAAMQQTAAQLGQAQGKDFAAIQAGFARALQSFTDAALYVGGNVQKDIKGVFAGAVPFLKLAGIVCGGWQMARAALAAEEKLAAGGGDTGFYQTKIATARFFAEHLLSQAPGLAATMIKGGASTLAVPEEFL
ncbi:MAG: 3-methylmercaptopropionyl-CoA dehydrogenase [Rhodocyclaceae bacterium]|nr:MAG: acyl-CoA dehydrogenase [Rhodocyclaceae bacterium]MBE7422397.1 acyl-CoA dehydrogenase [Zoogloeaceae bacterium]MBV6407062.1 3-methylmercaptopropionyl-CoA dehydrogenase [Rhodocyclaceae bacterium]MCK6382755.1 acyl-CoA dehydrogenase [Rhodocyclaceae bacterium]CAG0928796.1 3-(methylthio)propanoyl-CoA dehydrogenase [Rhodocyclaceae bacterium]